MINRKSSILVTTSREICLLHMIMFTILRFTYDLNLLKAYTCVKVCKDTTLTSSVASGGRARSKIRTPYRVRICRIFSLLL